MLQQECVAGFSFSPAGGGGGGGDDTARYLEGTGP